MNDDYLWDRSGEPDAEVRELEEILSALRYQPRPLEITSDVRIDQPRNFFSRLATSFAPRLALAATLALLLLGAGVWLGVQRWREQPAPVTARNAQAVPVREEPMNAPARVAKTNDTSDALASAPADGPKVQGRHRRANETLAIVRQREAKAAKEQLMFVLRLASAKLNFAQKKTLNTNPRDPVLNQHKIG